jgi:hypothetical protein
MEKHVRDQLVKMVTGLYLQKWNSVEIKELLLQKGLTQVMVDQVEEAGYREYRRMKRNANAHIASGIFLFVVGGLITWGSYSVTGGTMIVVALGLVSVGIADFMLGLSMRRELKRS